MWTVFPPLAGIPKTNCALSSAGLHSPAILSCIYVYVHAYTPLFFLITIHWEMVQVFLYDVLGRSCSHGRDELVLKFVIVHIFVSLGHFSVCNGHLYSFYFLQNSYRAISDLFVTGWSCISVHTFMHLFLKYNPRFTPPYKTPRSNGKDVSAFITYICVK